MIYITYRVKIENSKRISYDFKVYDTQTDAMDYVDCQDKLHKAYNLWYRKLTSREVIELLKLREKGEL